LAVAAACLQQAGAVPVQAARAILEFDRGQSAVVLGNFWRNGRWSLLFPHTAFDPAKN
jgi:hypothetical protein